MRLLVFELHASRARLLRALVRYGLPYAATALTLLLPLAVGDRFGPASGEIVTAHIADEIGSDWSEAHLGVLRLPGGNATLRVMFNIDPDVAASAEPLGLYLSGTFSASATWNGVLIGSKGRPGHSAADERPGPIDAVLHIPATAVRAGNNTLLLTMSSHYLSAPVTSIIHGTRELYGLRVDPFSANGRRPIGYYAVPFFMLGVLGAAVVFLGVSSTRQGAKIRPLSLTILGSLSVAALAEISRSMINYPYPLHDLRMTVLVVATACAGAVTAAYAISLSAISRRRFAPLVIATIAVIAGALLPIGLGPITVRILAVTIGVGLLAAVRGAAAGHPGSRELAAALGLLLAFTIFDEDLLMDRWLYAACIPLVTHLIWQGLPVRRAVEGVTAPGDTGQFNDRFVVRLAGLQRIIPLDQIRAIHGAGNYSELELETGQRILDDRSLTALSEALPLPFLRVHRSHIVNLRHVTKLRALGSGKYLVEFSDHASVPVSRGRVSDLRHAIETHFALPALMTKSPSGTSRS